MRTERYFTLRLHRGWRRGFEAFRLCYTIHTECQYQGIVKVPGSFRPSALWYSLPDHQCRFGVRAARRLTPKLFSAAGITGYRALRRPSSHLAHAPHGFACGTGCVLDHGRPPPRPATLLRHSRADLLPLRSQQARASGSRRRRKPGPGG